MWIITCNVGCFGFAYLSICIRMFQKILSSVIFYSILELNARQIRLLDLYFPGHYSFVLHRINVKF